MEKRHEPRAAVWRIVLIYALFAGLWIIVSDRLLVLAVSDQEKIGRLAIAKGWFFVVITSGLLYSLLRLDRTKLQQTVQALHENNEQLRWLEDNIPGCYMYQYVHGPDGRPAFLYVSAGVEELHQLTKTEVLRDADGLHRQIDPEQFTALLAAERESLRLMKDFDRELKIVRPDGGVRWLYVRSRPRLRPDGQVVWDGVATDVTGQKRAGEAWRESEERLRSLVTLLPDALFINQDNRVVFANRRALQLWRAEHEEQVLGRSPLDFFPPEEHGRVRDRIRTILQDGKNAPLWETRMVGLDGTVVPVETTAARFNFAGRPAIQVVVRDITGRKKAQESLRASEERLRIVTGSARVGLVMVDPEHRHIFANATYAEILELPTADLVGRHVGEVLAGIYADQIRPRLELAFAGERVTHQLYRTAGGKDRHYAVNFEPARAGDQVYAVVVVISDITDLKLAEGKLRLHEAVLRETGRIAKVGGWTCDVATGAGYWTEEVARIHDLEPDAPTSREIGLNYYLGESRRRIEAAWATAVQEGLSYDLELEMMTAKGVRKWIRTIGHPIIEEGRVVRLHGSYQDISERHHLDEERERQQRRLSLLADISQRLVLSDSPGEILEGIFNDLSRELQVDIFANYMVGPSGDRLLLESSGGLTESQRRDFAELPFGVSLCGLVAQQKERLVFADLPSVNVPQAAGIIALGVQAFAGHPLMAGDRLIGTICFGSRRIHRFTPDDVSLMKTVTDQVAAAVERHRLWSELGGSEERFRQMAESIDEVFWMTDTTHERILYVSPAYQRIWGRSIADLYAAPTQWLDAVVPEDRERVRRSVAQLITGESKEEYRITRPDGTIRWIFDRGFPVRNAAGIVYRVVGSAQDITDRKSLEAQFLRAQRLEAVGTLAGGVAHDLNNILAPVLMATGLVRDQLTDPRDQQLMTMVETSAKRGAAIISQLLTFSRGIEGARISVQLRHLMKDMVHLMRETFPRNIAVHQTTAPDLWSVMADATQMHQVLMNLCVNARDALPEGGGISLEAENLHVTEGAPRPGPEARPGRYVVVVVADTGTGIPAELLDRIFEPFFTTKDMGKGTGLGLSTVMGIVKSHGGFVTVDSKPGTGTTFRVYLPAGEGEATVTGPAETGTPPGGRGEMILVVDDEPSVRQATRYNLERQNYQVLVAADGKEAAGLFLQYQDQVKLVLTDVMMPVMSGAALVRALRTIKPNLRIVGTTGLDQEDRITELTALGVKHILRKPCTAGDLLRSVRRALDS